MDYNHLDLWRKLDDNTQNYENDEFIITYTIAPSDSTTLIRGTVVHKPTNEPAIGTNIWTSCLNEDGSQNGTLPDHKKGTFELMLPRQCNEIIFLKTPHKKIILTLNL